MTLVLVCHISVVYNYLHHLLPWHCNLSKSSTVQRDHNYTHKLKWNSIGISPFFGRGATPQTHVKLVEANASMFGTTFYGNVSHRPIIRVAQRLTQCQNLFLHRSPATSTVWKLFLPLFSETYPERFRCYDTFQHPMSTKINNLVQDEHHLLNSLLAYYRTVSDACMQ